MKRGQAAVEYILLIALGIFIIVIAFAFALWIKGYSDTLLTEVQTSRAETIQLFLQ